MRSKFDNQLALLNKELIEMGACCEQAIALAAKSLEDKNSALANDIISIDREIDQKERSIESLCLKMLLQQQPVARDLRQISAALKMITDMERIGDQASDIAEILKTAKNIYSIKQDKLSEMAKATIKMVTESINAYVERDVNLAKTVIMYDDVVDEFFNEIKSNLIKEISENANESEYAVDMLMIAKYFERIGDHATNIAEWVEFSVTGVHKGETEL